MKQWWSSLPRTKKAFAAIGGVGIAIALLSQLINALHMVETGRGLDPYHSGNLAQWNYVGLVIALAAMALAVIAGLLVRFYLGWRERQLTRALQDKYGRR